MSEAKSPSARDRAVGDRVLAALKQYGEPGMTAREAITLTYGTGGEVDEQVLSLSKSISMCWRNAHGEWKHVYRTPEVIDGSAVYRYVWRPEAEPRTPEAPSGARMRREQMAKAVCDFLNAHRGEWYDASALIDVIGYPAELPSFIGAMRTSAEDGLLPHIVRDRVDNRFVWGRPLPGPVKADRPSPFTAVGAVVFDEQSDTVAPVEVAEVLTPARPEVVERFAADHQQAVQALTASVEWETVTEQRKQGPVGEVVTSVLLKRADGTLWKAVPFEL